MDSNCAASKLAVKKEPQGSVQSGICIQKGQEVTRQKAD